MAADEDVPMSAPRSGALAVPESFERREPRLEDANFEEARREVLRTLAGRMIRWQRLGLFYTRLFDAIEEP